ncbi:inactive pancreatic lipase-related protein 1-like isoform X2 [Stegodyphus dumicola]|uniref:inactive pancreatic lipase-related protein 1-like isoform X2 n=1 Tax=Stegodyphus dumicola TaxID=202533 RepID=UPI0015ABEAFB|nr:inactive pancreatic lipase-related protein 1-like isoform X2 [Stegodyphus dumicola]
MGFNMASIAVLCLLLLERFLASDMDEYTEPVLNGLRVLEQQALRITPSKRQPNILTKHRQLTRLYLFSRDSISEGLRLDLHNDEGFLYFNPHLDTKIIIHGFMDKARIADWMHAMKDEFLLLDDLNVIIVDWSYGNFIPYTRAAGNTQQVGEEISEVLKILINQFGAKPSKFHLIGHSLGSHVAGHVGERVKGLQRITGLDPATYLFSNISPRGKLDRSDAVFVDVIHTDAGGIGMVETVGHVDFYPNGGEVQPQCTASNSLKTLLERGVVEGVRDMICSHMRAPMLFIETINRRHCQMLAHKCSSWDAYLSGQCDTCNETGNGCAYMSYHLDMKRNYGNDSKYFLITAGSPPYCGYSYKIVLKRITETGKAGRRSVPAIWKRGEWSDSDILRISVYGVSGSAEFKIEGKQALYSVTELCVSPMLLNQRDQQGATFRSEFC